MFCTVSKSAVQSRDWHAIFIIKGLNGVCTLFRDRTFVYPCTARSQRESDSPVVSETAGSQRGMRGRGKTASAQSCKLVE